MRNARALLLLLGMCLALPRTPWIEDAPAAARAREHYLACAAFAVAHAEPAPAAELERGFWLSLSGASGAIFVRYNVDSHLAVGFRSWERFACPGLGYWSPLSDGSGTVLLDAPVFNEEKWDAIRKEREARAEKIEADEARRKWRSRLFASLFAAWLALEVSFVLCLHDYGLTSAVIYGVAFLRRLWEPQRPPPNFLVITVQVDGEPGTRMYFRVAGFVRLRRVLVRYSEQLRQRWPFRWPDTDALRLTFHGRSDIEQETAWSLGLQDGGALVVTENPVPFRPDESG